VQVFVIWASGVVTFSVTFSSPDMLVLDMSLGTLPEETVGLEGPETLAVGMNDPLGFFREMDPDAAGAYVARCLGGDLQTAYSSLFARDISIRCGQVWTSSPCRWSPIGWLDSVTRAGLLVGLALARKVSRRSL